MQILPLASSFTDNWFYLIVADGEGLLVDPIDAEVAVRAVEASGVGRVRLFVTHAHPDHIGGNDAVVEALGCEVIASAYPDVLEVARDTSVCDGDVIEVGDSSWQVRHAPGHTAGHIVLHSPGHLISGDVFFAAGVGHCRFGGEPGELHATVNRRLRDVPDDTVFYPGHDYAARNTEWVLSVEPGNATAAAQAGALADHRRADGPALYTLGHERSFNPFHRVDEAGLQAHLAATRPDVVDASVTDPAERAFRALRSLRDVY